MKAKPLDITVFEVRDKISAPAWALVRATLGDGSFHAFIDAQIEATRQMFTEIDPRTFENADDYKQIAMDAQLLCRFWGDLRQYAETLKRE